MLRVILRWLVVVRRCRSRCFHHLSGRKGVVHPNETLPEVSVGLKRCSGKLENQLRGSFHALRFEKYADRLLGTPFS